MRRDRERLTNLFQSMRTGIGSNIDNLDWNRLEGDAPKCESQAIELDRSHSKSDLNRLLRKYTVIYTQAANYLSILRTSGINAIPRFYLSVAQHYRESGRLTSASRTSDALA
jgi:hypothetical protein